MIISEDERAEILNARFAEILRDLMRAVAANDPVVSISSAARMMSQFDAINREKSERVDWHKIFDGAVQLLQPQRPYDEIDHEFLRLSKTTLKYLAELTATDEFSAARISKSRSAVEDEMKFVQQRRKIKQPRG